MLVERASAAVGGAAVRVRERLDGVRQLARLGLEDERLSRRAASTAGTKVRPKIRSATEWCG